jgi:peptide-methionine (S)-S-oxide reductase
MRFIFAPILIMLAAGAAILFAQPARQAAPAKPGARAAAVFAGGCFWCTESDFDHVPGVISTTSGYSGGRIANPTYEQVSAGGTGHIESVRVVYDPARISYASLVERFFPTIDPVDAGGQFCDHGSQYRSAIFVANPRERAIAEAAKAKAARALKVPGPIVTLILPAARFYPAEDYHQDYYRKNPIRYKFYRTTCGRDARLSRVWGR